MFGALGDMFKNLASDILPRKSVEQIIEEQNTKSVWLPVRGGLPKKYVYGKMPGEPLVDHD